MSNHKAGENPARRIPKVSHATSIGVGLVGPKAQAIAVTDGHQVNIPEHLIGRSSKSELKLIAVFGQYQVN